MAVSILAQSTPTVQVDTWAALKAMTIPGVPGKLTALVKGRVSTNDGGGGIFFFTPGPGATDDGGTIATPNVGTGAWFRQYSGPISLLWFGGGSGVTDDTALIQTAITLAGGKHAVSFEGSNVFLCNLVITQNNVLLIGGTGGIDYHNSGTPLIRPFVASKPVIQFGNDSSLVSGFTMRDITVNGALLSTVDSVAALQLAGGSQLGRFLNCTFLRGTNTILITSAPGNPNTLHTFTMCNIQQINSLYSDYRMAVKGVFTAGDQFATAFRFDNSYIQSGGTAASIYADGVPIYLTDTYVDSNTNVVILTNSGTINIANATLDNGHKTSAIKIDTQTKNPATAVNGTGYTLKDITQGDGSIVTTKDYSGILKNTWVDNLDVGTNSTFAGTAIFSSGGSFWADNTLGSELAVNGDNEAGIMNLSGYVHLSNSTWAQSGTVSHGGTKSAKLTAIAGGTFTVNLGGSGTFVPGSRYDISVWIYVPSTDTAGVTGVAYVTDFGSVDNVSPIIGTSNLRNTWQKLESFVTIRSTNVSTELTFSTGGAPLAGDIIYLDDLSVKQVTGGDVIAGGLFTGGGTTGLKVTATGNVGIGTNAPNSKLDLNGEMNISGESAPSVSATNAGKIYFDTTTKKLMASESGAAYVNVIGSGTTISGLTANTIVKATSATNVGNSKVTDDGTTVTVTASDNVLVSGGTVTLQNTNTSAGALIIKSETGTDNAVQNESYSSTVSAGFVGKRARGTIASPTAAQSGDLITKLGARPFGATAFASGDRARVGLYDKENATDSAMGTYATVETTPTGSTTIAERVRVNDTDSVFATTLALGATTAAPDVYLVRDGAANTLGLKNGVNAQTFRLFNTSTDASNYERLGLYFTGNRIKFGTENAGTGTLRSMDIGPNPNGTPGSAVMTLQGNSIALFYGSSGTAGWTLTSTGEWQPASDASLTLGDATHRVKYGFFGGSTETTSNPILTEEQTWNSGGVTFTGHKMNITDTASASASLFQDWQVGGVSKASLRKDGLMTANGFALAANGNTFAGTSGTLRMDSSVGALITFSGNTFSVTGNGLNSNTKLFNYNGINTAGLGLPAIYGANRATGQTAGNTNVVSYVNGVADGSFEVSANVLVTTSSAEAFGVVVLYTDEGNTARTQTLPFVSLAGTVLTQIAFANGAVPYEGCVIHLRVKASTTIYISVPTSGTFTGCVFNVGGIIKQTQ